MRRLAVGVLLALLLPLAACSISAGDRDYRGYRYDSGHRGHYPPPHEGRWRWDDDVRAYVSLGYPSVYYGPDRRYLRWHDNRWVRSSHWRGPWRAVDYRQVPAPLIHRHRPDARWHHDGRRDYREQWRQPHEGNWQRDRHDGHADWQRREFERQQLERRQFERQRAREEAARREHERRMESLHERQRWQREHEAQQRRYEAQERRAAERRERQEQWRQQRREETAQRHERREHQERHAERRQEWRRGEGGHRHD